MSAPAAGASATQPRPEVRTGLAAPTLASRRLAERFQNIEDLRREAKRRLPKGVFEFFDRGSEDEISLAETRAAFRRIKLRNKVLVDVSNRSPRSELFGKPLAMPLVVAPTGIAGLTWYMGELELARAAQRFGVPFTLATPSITSIETIAQVEGGRNWFQLYMWRDREASYQLVKRARDAGFEALILTVDTQVSPIREYNRRNGFNSPFTFNWKIAADVAMHPGWLLNVLLPYMRTTGMPRPIHYPKGSAGRATSGLAGMASAMRGDDLSWDDIARLREIWPGPMMIKGVHLPEDAERAVKEGLDGVILSNHGGRNLDGAVSPIEILPEIVAAVGNRTNVLIDSGVRRGSDILKALALGAKAVLSGRCGLYGTAVGGQEGALHALSILRKELDTSMAYTGCRSVDEAGPRTVWLGPETTLGRDR